MANRRSASHYPGSWRKSRSHVTARGKQSLRYRRIVAVNSSALFSSSMRRGAAASCVCFIVIDKRLEAQFKLIFSSASLEVGVVADQNLS